MSVVTIAVILCVGAAVIAAVFAVAACMRSSQISRQLGE